MVKLIPATSDLQTQSPRKDPTLQKSTMDAHNQKLWLPSELPTDVACEEYLRVFEWELRRAQADESLESIRNSLEEHSRIRKKKLRYGHSVRAGTASQNNMREAMDKARFAADTYRNARAALIALAEALPADITGDTLKCFPPLLDSDLREIGSSELELGDGKKEDKISWIWKSYGSASGEHERIHDGTLNCSILHSCTYVNLH
jgi:hypothetical protein